MTAWSLKWNSFGSMLRRCKNMHARTLFILSTLVSSSHKHQSCPLLCTSERRLMWLNFTVTTSQKTGSTFEMLNLHVSWVIRFLLHTSLSPKCTTAAPFVNIPIEIYNNTTLYSLENITIYKFYIDLMKMPCSWYFHTRQQQLWRLYIAHRCMDFASLEPVKDWLKLWPGLRGVISGTH